MNAGEQEAESYKGDRATSAIIGTAPSPRGRTREGEGQKEREMFGLVWFGLVWEAGTKGKETGQGRI